MIRRLLAALLVAAIAMPFPAFAVASSKACPMAEHAAMGPNHRCCCNESAPAPSGAGEHKGCAATTASTGGCDCAIQADAGRQPVAPVATASEAPAKAPAAPSALIPASRSTPQRQARAVHVSDPPPAPGLVSRPLLCSWTL